MATSLTAVTNRWEAEIHASVCYIDYILLYTLEGFYSEINTSMLTEAGSYEIPVWNFFFTFANVVETESLHRDQPTMHWRSSSSIRISYL